MFDGHHYFGGPFRPPQPYNASPYFNWHNKFVNVELRYLPVIVSRSNPPATTEFPSKPIPPRANPIFSDPPPVSSAPAETKLTPNRTYHQPPAPNPNDPVEDFCPVITYNGTKVEDTTWMSDKARAYHAFLLRHHDFPAQPAQPNPAPAHKPAP